MENIERNTQGHVMLAALTPEEMGTIFWALYNAEKLSDVELSKDAMKLRADLSGMEKITVSFDGRGKNGL